MPLPFTCNPLPRDTERVPVSGISEWEHVFYMLPDKRKPPEHPVEDCIDAHLAAGLDHIVWNCGRSTVDYRTELPGASPFGVDGAAPDDGTAAAFKKAMLRRFCPLRRALEYGHRQGMAILGRLAMNRHYGAKTHPQHVSAFAAGHPEYHEQDKTPGWGRNSSRLCYAIPEVRRERLDILLEIQRIGVDALVLDFCRQPPMLLYHPALVEPFREKTGCDPLAIDSDAPDDYREWFQYRADVMTGFMHDLRGAARRQEKQLGRACPIVARVPDNAPWLNLAYGCDTEAWLAGNLCDALMLSPFPLAVEDPGRYPEHYIEQAHRHGKACFGGLGSKGLMAPNHPHAEPATVAAQALSVYRARPVYELLDRQLRAGADGISVYQSETLARQPHLRDVLPHAGHKRAVARRLDEATAAEPPADHWVGVDWHSAWLDESGPHGQLLGLRPPQDGKGWRML